MCYRDCEVYENVVAVIFQNTFYLKIHLNNIYFLFFKNYFSYQHIKTIKKHKNILFFLNTFKTEKQTKYIYFS
jgi:hypothetical protein